MESIRLLGFFIILMVADPEIQGSEKLVISNCIGKFEGVENFLAL